MQLLHKWPLKGTKPLPAGRLKQVKVSQRGLKNLLCHLAGQPNPQRHIVPGARRDLPHPILAVQPDAGKGLSLCISVQHVGADGGARAAAHRKARQFIFLENKAVTTTKKSVGRRDSFKSSDLNK